MTDTVNHPQHYTSHPSGVECITVVEHMTFNVGNAIKYLWRAGLKDDGLTKGGFVGDPLKFCDTRKEKHIEDLKKARWYIDREIQRVSE